MRDDGYDFREQHGTIRVGRRTLESGFGPFDLPARSGLYSSWTRFDNRGPVCGQPNHSTIHFLASYRAQVSYQYSLPRS